jgi:hypothetical protein
MFSTDFHLRPAEVESELDPHRRLPPRLLADIGQTYNRMHRIHPLQELDLRMVGQAIKNGRPEQKVNQIVERWERP